jgi:hypothetical protein
MSYVPGGQVMVDSAADGVGDPKQTRMRVMMANRIRDWGTKTLATRARAQKPKFSESRVIHPLCSTLFLRMEYGETCIGPGLISSLCISAPGGLKEGAKVEIQKHRKNRPTAAKGRVFDAIVPHFEFRPATLSIKIENRCWVRGRSASRLPKAEMGGHPRDL